MAETWHVKIIVKPAGLSRDLLVNRFEVNDTDVTNIKTSTGEQKVLVNRFKSKEDAENFAKKWNGFQIDNSKLECTVHCNDLSHRPNPSGIVR